MQRSSLLSSSLTPFSPFPLLPTTQRVEPLILNRCRSSAAFQSSPKVQLNSSPFYRHTLHALQSTAIEEIVETSCNELELIEIGYISAVHGLQGELRVKPSTDFPELRLSKPGKRWLRERVSGKEVIREVELVEGRGHPGQKSWIVSINGIDTVDKAKQLVGSTLLVREQDRPFLEEGEFYTPDLVGMTVILKDTGETVGTVVNVFTTGASDLLQVMLQTGSSKLETSVSGPLVWIPFVEAIVPDVDMGKREMQITPPKGLLELNIRSDMRSKKERRQLEWKQRKKLQQRVIAAKKKLIEMRQQHIFHGFRYGEKVQASLLADQIASVNTNLLQRAMQNTKIPSERWDLSKFMNANSSKLLKNHLKIPKECLTPCGSKEKLDKDHQLQQRGALLMSKGHAAIILVVDGNDNCADGTDPDFGESESGGDSPNALLLQALLRDDRRFTKVEEHVSVPLIVVSPAHGIQSFQKIFSDNDYFSLDAKKVWFLEEEKLPVVSSSLEEENMHKVLMKSPWEILQSPVGSGGVFSILSTHNILENLSEFGVEYVQVCSLVQSSVTGNQLFFGLVDSCEADVGIKIFNNMEDSEQAFDMIFSMRFLKMITKQMDKLQIYTAAKQNSHVEKVDKEWVDVVPTSPNSYELRSSIYSSLDACSSDKICVMELTD